MSLEITTEGGVIHSDCRTGVSPAKIGGMKQALIFGSMDERGTRPVIERGGDGNSRPKRKKSLMVCRL